MNRAVLRYFNRQPAADDKPLFVVRRDYSAGMNSRHHPSHLPENQATILYNIDLSTAGQRIKRPGSVQIGNDLTGANACVALGNFPIDGATDQLLLIEDTNLWKWTGSGNWSSLYSSLTATSSAKILHCKESGLSPDDVVLVSNGTDNVLRVDSAGNTQDLGDTNSSPPKTLALAWLLNRVWGLKGGLLYFSDAYPADYSTAFDRTTDAFKIYNIGKERALLTSRQAGFLGLPSLALIILGELGIWALSPSLTPDPTIDKPIPLNTANGCVEGETAVIGNGDVFYLAPDGVHSLQADIAAKFQGAQVEPLSYVLKDEFDNINWSQISKARAVFFDNKYFLALPTGTSTVNNEVWVYYTNLKAWMIISGWNVACWAKYKVDGEERLYYGHNANNVVYRAWYGYTDEGTTTTDGTAINFQFESKEEDLGQPLNYKTGGEVEVKASSANNTSIDIYAAFGEGDYNLLGSLNLASQLITFPLNFPVNFPSETILAKKFHLDPYGRWRTIKIKLQHNDKQSSNDIKIVEHSIVSYLEEYRNQ